MLYVDSSALLKAVVEEAESGAFRRLVDGLEASALVASALARTDLVRAAARRGAAEVAAARTVLSRVTLVAVTGELLDTAGALPPAGLRSLDAIHVATALELRPDLEALVTYDTRTAEAAEHHGVRVLAPR